MRIRFTRLVSAAVVVVLGLLALRRASHDAVVPVAPGSWEPVD